MKTLCICIFFSSMSMWWISALKSTKLDVPNSAVLHISLMYLEIQVVLQPCISNHSPLHSCLCHQTLQNKNIYLSLLSSQDEGVSGVCTSTTWKWWSNFSLTRRRNICLTFALMSFEIESCTRTNRLRKMSVPACVCLRRGKWKTFMKCSVCHGGHVTVISQWLLSFLPHQLAGL